MDRPNEVSGIRHSDNSSRVIQRGLGSDACYCFDHGPDRSVVDLVA